MIESKPNSAKIWLEILKNTDKPVIVFTTGAAGHDFYRILTERGVGITCFADNSEEKVGQRVDMITTFVETFSFHDIINHYSDAYVVIPPRKYLYEIQNQFITAGYDKNKLVSADFGVLKYNISKELCKEAYDLLSDDRSRDIFADRLNYLHAGDITILEQTRNDDQMYFDRNIIALSGQEVFVDGGGYTGDTFLQFIKIAKTFKYYYFCEPDPINMRIAKDNLIGHEGIEYVNEGLYSKRNLLSFSATGSTGSRFGRHGNVIKINVISIDEILSGKPATFIKMNIEGAEIDALNGAIKTIQKYKPRLAIMANHEAGDFIDIPILIFQLNPEYKLYMRHYNKRSTVCYAI